jgi:hypothetical protein
MGLDLSVACGELPGWATIGERVRGRGLTIALRMIDGLPAFPDEEPPADWRELRVSLPAGMVTIRREAGGVRLVTWGDSPPELLAQRDALAAALGG